MELSPRTLALLPELDAVAVAAEGVEAAEARLLLPDLPRWTGAGLRGYHRAMLAYKAARIALDARSRALALDQQEGLRVDPVALWDATDDEDEIPGEATVRARQKIRARRLSAPTGDPGFWNRKSPVQTKWGNKSVIPHELGPREALA